MPDRSGSPHGVREGLQFLGGDTLAASASFAFRLSATSRISLRVSSTRPSRAGGRAASTCGDCAGPAAAAPRAGSATAVPATINLQIARTGCGTGRPSLLDKQLAHGPAMLRAHVFVLAGPTDDDCRRLAWRKALGSPRSVARGDRVRHCPVVDEGDRRSGLHARACGVERELIV